MGPKAGTPAWFRKQAFLKKRDKEALKLQEQEKAGIKARREFRDSLRKTSALEPKERVNTSP